MGFHDAYTQILILGALAFCCPGMFNAINGLGGAGSASLNAGSIANASLYAAFAFFGYFGGAFFNLMGNKILVSLGGLTYCIYAAGMYLCGKKENCEWLAGVVGACLGVGAGWFWTSHGAMTMAYATPSQKGRYISVFWVIFNLGGMMGGLLTFILNFQAKDEIVSASAGSYFTLIAIMGLGAVAALFLIAPPSSVIRADGEPIVFEKQSVMEEIKGAIGVTFHKPMLILTIPFMASNWFYTYQFSGYNRYLFNIRTRGLNTGLYWGAQMFGAWIFGKILDLKGYSVRKRGFFALILLSVVLNLAFALNLPIQYFIEGGFDKGTPPSNKPIDFSEVGRYAFPCIVYLLYGIGDAMLQTYAYWAMASIAGDGGSLCARYAGFYKGTQSLGAAISWAVDIPETSGYKPQFWTCWILLIISLPLFSWVNSELQDSQTKDLKESEMKFNKYEVNPRSVIEN